ncbi:MAG: Hsp70 family protein, partial [Deltaproteobacteria bacterium]|nr:Hsp70 family protein [Deltaproteobacteria bacterium]
MAVVGIDLGTTNTVIGVVRDGQAKTVRDPSGSALIPSVVSFHPNGSVLVGAEAKERRMIDARNTIYSVKRLIGRTWSSPEVAAARARFPFEMREGPGQAALVVARGESFTLPEISAFVLRHARTVAEQALGEPVDRAVVTVPANFNDLQRAATKVAGRVAGLEILRILNEPTAAALAYGYGKGKGERIAIYDFGGGTFDVTVLDLAGNVFEVLATAGNTFLGGDDIDLAIAEEMATECLKQHRIDAHADAQVFERLRYHAERVKISLSNEEQVLVDVPEIGHASGGRAVRLTYPLTRSHLDALAGPLVEKTFAVCDEALAVARLRPQDLDQVVLVGGSTRLPLVRRRVEEYFGRAPLDRVSPDEVVAIGAAIQANALTSTERRRSLLPRAPLPASRDGDGGGADGADRRSEPP